MKPFFGYDAVAVRFASDALVTVISSPLSQITSVGAEICSAVVIVPVKSSVAGSIVSSTALCVGCTVVGSRSSGGVGAGFGAAATGFSIGGGAAGSSAGFGAAELQAARTTTSGDRFM